MEIPYWMSVRKEGGLLYYYGTFYGKQVSSDCILISATTKYNLGLLLLLWEKTVRGQIV